MIDSEVAISVAVLALHRAGKLTNAALRKLLDSLRVDTRATMGASALSVEDVLDMAGVPRPHVNMSVGEVERDIDRGLALGIAPVPLSSPLYPELLRRAGDAPLVLFVRGSIKALALCPGIAVVGTRRASPHGIAIAERMAQYLSDEGWSVVSGLTIGIDAAAHNGALKGKSPTIAVMGHGLERAMPAAMRPLADRILEDGGAWISEYPVGVKATPESLVSRVRIQIGITCASVIVEGGETSAASSHAQACVLGKRALFAVVPQTGANVKTTSALSRMLVAEHGATPIHSREDYPAMLERVAQRAEELRAAS